jgi:hypothetical protein
MNGVEFVVMHRGPFKRKKDLFVAFPTSLREIEHNNNLEILKGVTEIFSKSGNPSVDSLSFCKNTFPYLSLQNSCLIGAVRKNRNCNSI